MTEKEIYEGMRVAILKEKSKLEEVSQNIWEHPELAFEEVFAHDLLCDALENYGFTVSRSYKLSTAFKAEFKIDSETTQKGRTVAIICEYDALPELGHGCGHNLIAECGLGAALGVKAIMESRMSGVVGTLVVMGTPAEEKGKGKVKLIEAGAFNGIDMALMAHPGPGNLAHPLTYLALTEFDVKFVGRAAHAANYPWGGINALDGVVLCYSNITALRQQMKPSWRVHMNITNGGAALNVIPEIAEMQIMVRALTFSELEILKKDIINCIHGAATASKCEVSITEGVSMKNVMSNYELAKTYRKYSEMSGEKFLDDDPHQTIVTSGSTDMGNVTHIMPGIHPKFFIGKQVGCHTKQFARGSKNPKIDGLPYMVLGQFAEGLLPTDNLPKENFADDFANELTTKHRTPVRISFPIGAHWEGDTVRSLVFSGGLIKGAFGAHWERDTDQSPVFGSELISDSVGAHWGKRNGLESSV
ncbi:Peptidase M20 domain-containing protein 2 [Nymphon striatum]|nr:Peptidase M20 domain-containing protein 2 [Nymphon striatum]KAG1676310.1 Peptidase M20 domain-containing protein 2 [Nymphon striatum]KAG1676313.1 Peptidase M20 domain-containing protein 2 [Nymphon striatum]